MFGCKSCGAYLHFDIETQKLKCDYCGSLYRVYEAQQIRTAKETVTETVDSYAQEDPFLQPDPFAQAVSLAQTASDSLENPSQVQPEQASSQPDGEEQMEIYSFDCPQCGGTIYGDRQDMTGFCSFCGSPVELSGRLTTIEQPHLVIPFQKTKEDCKKIFKKMVRSNPFLPSGYKDVKHIDSFRGIYMPYSLQRVNYDGHFEAFGKEPSYRRGDYVYTDVFSITGNLNGYYKGFEHDASTTFDDEISEALGPYSTGNAINFHPGYLAGFYADASDEPGWKYMQDAEVSAAKRLHGRIKDMTHRANRSVSIETKDSVYLTGNMVQTESEKAMYPVWFMSYKNGDRVAYAAVNGQTGKITADLPIDFKKFLLFALIAIVPIYFLLESFLVLMPATMMVIYAVCCMLSTYLLHVQAAKIMRHEKIDPIFKRKKKKKIDTKYIDGDKVFNFVIHLIPLVTQLTVIFIATFWSMLRGLGIMLPLLGGLATGFFAWLFIKEQEALYFRFTIIRGKLLSIISAVCVTLGLFIFYRNPAEDLWYYGGCFMLLLCILADLLTIVRNHNCLTTRRPAQFAKKGGDDLA